MRYQRLLIVLLLIAAVLGVEWLWLRLDNARPSPAAPASIAAGGVGGAYAAAVPGGDFSLVSHSGLRVTRDSFEGRFLLLAFGYSACPDICPLTLVTLAQTLERLGPLARRAQVLFVTLDPERDSAAVLADYVPVFDPRIVGLTGSLAEIKDIARKYRVRFAKAGEGPDYSIDHSAALYLVAPDGRVIGYFRHDTAPEDLAAAVRAALGDPPPGLTWVKDGAVAPSL